MVMLLLRTRGRTRGTWLSSYIINSCSFLKFASTVKVTQRDPNPSPSHRRQPRVYLLNHYKEPFVSLEEGLRALRAYSLFRPETVEISLKFNLKGQNQIRGTIVFPHYFGGKSKILVFAEDSAATSAKEAGASVIGGLELIKEIETTDVVPDCHVILSTPSMLEEVKKIARILKTKMPSERRGTVVEDIPKAMEQFAHTKAYRSIDGILNIGIGEINFPNVKIRENLDALMNLVLSQREKVKKKDFIKKITLSTTYGPGFDLLIDNIINIKD
ncbi:PREDICTED: uncharacterized protein LOC100633802 [Amphimedon queenslandica]|uniref:Ribosomal protein n=1 Tax=Amphimedon queenslandica TaxID=400682 RepID=A0A1X7V6D4_AMPQE|nr:PREDICTED: uncharacterized protein LOC100633802 [Amphimedon queenslandica]|eukprot:XP_003385532.1 PREDICTED: uncharacterized protein LOC100633802 [Amphimedon queenslandica]